MVKERVIIGLDLSVSSTGFAIIKNNEVIYCGKICTKPKDFSGNELKRMYFIANSLKELVEKYEVGYVSIENTYTGVNPKTSTMLAKLCGFVCKALMDYNENMVIGIYMPSSIRKGVIGIGNATKQKVANYIRENYIDIGEYSDKQSKTVEKTSDIYDAIITGLYMYKRMNGDIK